MALVSLGEGNTPLIPSVRIGRSLGLKRLFFKLETCNPSGSYKDRFIRAEIERMLKDEVRACMATSSGNTGSSLAAYSARYGLSCFIVVNQEVPSGKLAQMRAHGARVFRVRDFATSSTVTQNVLGCLRTLSETYRMPLVVSAYRYCPDGMAGVESMSEELARQCFFPLAHVFVPVGGGGLFTAVCRGFSKLSSPGPRVHAVQPEGCSTVVASFMRGDSEIRPVKSTTHISGLAVPFDIDGSAALEELRQCGGQGFTVSDDEVYAAQRMMLSQEGIYAEPAGATALAGLLQAVRKETVKPDEAVVCLVTGHGFKDPDSVLQAAAQYPAVSVGESELQKSLADLISSGG